MKIVIEIDGDELVYKMDKYKDITFVHGHPLTEVLKPLLEDAWNNGFDSFLECESVILAAKCAESDEMMKRYIYETLKRIEDGK